MAKFGQESKHEVVDIAELRVNNDWLYSILLGYIPEDKFKDLCASPDFRVKEMRLTIEINGVQITNATLNDIINTFTDRMLDAKMEREGLNSLREAAAHHVDSVFNGQADQIRDAAQSLVEQMRELSNKASRTLDLSDFSLTKKRPVAEVGMAPESHISVTEKLPTEEMIAAGVAYLNGIPQMVNTFPPHQRKAIAEYLYREMEKVRK